MIEIIKLNLETEMDLILANKQAMKLAELCGLSVTIQTGLATAVSEISRYALALSRHSILKLGIVTLSPTKKQITAIVCNTVEACANPEALSFAKKLITHVDVIKNNLVYDIKLSQDLKFSGIVTDKKIESFVDYFKTAPALSPYDEIRKKNIQLLHISDKLKESEKQYRGLAETLPIMMFLVNPAGEVIYTNEWFISYFGSTYKGVNTILPWKELLHAEDYLSMNKELEKIFKSNNSYSTQARLKHKNTGKFLWHLISFVPVKNDKNTITQWTGFFVDINAQKNIEEALKDNIELKEAHTKLVEYQKRLEEKISELNISNHELEQFAYIASHDLQEPLRKIIIFSNLLDDKLKDIDEESKMYFNKIISSSKRMTILINDVLDWSKISKTKIEFTSVDLNIIIEDVKSDLEMVMRQKQAVINMAALPVVMGVPLQLTQLFTNLISNALKFCKKLPVINITSSKLTLNEIEESKILDHEMSYMEIKISDNGIGFEQEYNEKIFKIFQRLHGSTDYTGTGIGLAICKKIVENHNGIISAKGNPGNGATFTIVIPC